MASSPSRVINVTTVFGRVVAAMRRESRLSQAGFAAEMRVDRSHLARIETGRNIATVDDIFRIGGVLDRLDVVSGEGDLMGITLEAIQEVRDRRTRVAFGKLAPRPGETVMDGRLLDRTVIRVVDGWLEEHAESTDS